MKVKDLIQKLSAFDPEAIVVIDDADTNAALPVSSVEAVHALVAIGGEYGNSIAWTEGGDNFGERPRRS